MKICHQETHFIAHTDVRGKAVGGIPSTKTDSMKSAVDESVVSVLTDAALQLTDVGLLLTDVSLPLTGVPSPPVRLRKRLIGAVLSGDSWVNMVR